MRNLIISAAHIPGKTNIDADQEPRKNRTETKWMLKKDLLADALDTLNFKSDIDMLLSLRLTNSSIAMLLIDHQTRGQQQWTLSVERKNYVFPAFSLIYRWC